MYHSTNRVTGKTVMKLIFGFLAFYVTPLWAFTDVPSDRWGYTYINILADNEITSGCDSENYCPDNDLQRAEMAIFLLRSQYGSSYSPSTASGAIFDDVSTSFWAGNFVERLSELGITSGCDASNFCPSRNITRSEMAIFLLRTKYGSDYSPPTATGTIFGDISADYWAASFIEQLDAEGWSDDTLDTTRECAEGNFCPSLTINRAEMAVFLVKTFGLEATSGSEVDGDAANGELLFNAQGCADSSCHGADISENLNNIQNGTDSDTIDNAFESVSEMAAMGYAFSDQEVADLAAWITEYASSTVTGDAVDGASLYTSKTCSGSSCHNTNARENKNRILAGLNTSLIDYALTNVQQMESLQGTLTAQDKADLAAYLDSLIVPVTEGDSEQGEALYGGSIFYGCSQASCHGSDPTANLNNIQNGVDPKQIATALVSVTEMRGATPQSPTFLSYDTNVTSRRIANIAAWIQEQIQ
ncbi:MAG: S-layer homology domain-containing protein [Magnetococcales bacterium]|nr:S-layer homology domain-containing protein [Magnetococcales bacterium]